MSKKIKNIPVKDCRVNLMSVAEFRRLGYLQELNRLWLHPLGLALEVIVAGGNEHFGQIWDSRDDPEGIIFDKSMLDEEFKKRAQYVAHEIGARAASRFNALGWIVQPVPNDDPDLDIPFYPI